MTMTGHNTVAYCDLSCKHLMYWLYWVYSCKILSITWHLLNILNDRISGKKSLIKKILVMLPHRGLAENTKKNKNI